MTRRIILTLLLVSGLLVSCEDWLTIRPRTEIEKEKLFSSESGFWEALTGTYALFLGTQGNYGVIAPLRTSTIEHLANLWTTRSQTDEWMIVDHLYKEPKVDAKMGDIFLNQYKIITHVNTILEYIDRADFLPEESYNMIKGEALAIRAFVHFDLIRLWGPIPGKAEEGKRYLPYVKTVSKQAKTYDTYREYMTRLNEDMADALALLGKCDPLLKYTCAQTAQFGKLEYKTIHWYWRQNKFNYYAVLGLQARVALWQGDKTAALAAAAKVIEAKNTDGTPKFRLGTAADMTDMQNAKENNNTLRQEHLFGLAVSGRSNHVQWFPPFFNLIPYKIDDIFKDKNDFRYKMWFWENKDKEPMQMTSYKYKNNNDVSSNPLWLPMIRISEMYLIAAECADLPTANTMYAAFCASRGETFVPLTESNRQELLLTEYYREFNIEGQIFFANKRMNIRNMYWYYSDMAEMQYVLPIPRKEVEIFN